MSQRYVGPKSSQRWKIATGFSLSMLASVTVAAYCPPQYQEQTVLPAFEAATETLSAAVMAVDQSLSQILEFQSQRLMSAIAVLTKQKALAANQIADGQRVASQQTATAMNILSQTQRVKDARFDYGGEFGQGFSPCKVYATRAVITARDADMGNQVRERVMSEITAAPGRYADPVAAQAELVRSREDFCTQDQVDSGMCNTVGELPGADLSVSTLFEPAMEGEKLYDAKVAFINNVAGLPDGPVPKEAGNSAATSAYAMIKARKDAFVSPALAGLKEVQLDYSGVSGTETGTDLPVAVHFRNEVKRYSGNSPEYDAWARVLSAQNERGALVELLKVTAVDLAIKERTYRQYEKMEAQLAALTAMTIDSANGAVKDAAERASSQTMKNSIK